MALVMLSRLASTRDQALRKQAVEKATIEAWRKFSKLAARFSSDSRRNRIMLAARYSGEYLTSIIDALQTYYNVLQTPPGLTSNQDFLTLSVAVNNNRRNLDKMLNSLTSGVGTHHALETEWSDLQKAWATLDSYIRPQRDEFGLPWFLKTSTRNCAIVSPATVAPVVTFISLNANAHSAINAVIVNIPDTKKPEFDALCSSYKRSLEDALSSRFSKSGRDASEFLVKLHRSLEDVRKTDWPFWISD